MESLRWNTCEDPHGVITASPLQPFGQCVLMPVATEREVGMFSTIFCQVLQIYMKTDAQFKYESCIILTHLRCTTPSHRIFPHYCKIAGKNSKTPSLCRYHIKMKLMFD